MLDKVKHIILIVSGKGGVGKSTISSQLSLALAKNGLKVGLLDIDLCGPSIPYMLGLENESIFQSESGWIPIKCKETNLSVMSIGFLLKNRNDAVIWRGPKKNSMIRQFLDDVHWGELDYLIIDTPPGTSDEHISVMECLKNVALDGAIVITTPQQISLDDVRKEITFCKKTNLNIIGILENMNGYMCPHCNISTNIFSSSGGEALASLANVPFLGSLSFDTQLGKISENLPLVLSDEETTQAKNAAVFKNILDKLLLI